MNVIIYVRETTHTELWDPGNCHGLEVESWKVSATRSVQTDLNFSFLSHVPLAFYALSESASPELENLISKLLKILSLEVEKLNILFKYGAIINCVAMETFPPMCSATCLLPIIQK